MALCPRPLFLQEQTLLRPLATSEKCQQPTFDISSSFASRNHVAHAVVNCLLYSLDKQRSPLTIEDGAPGPVGANVKRERATPLLIYAFPSQGTLAAYCRFLRADGVEVEESGAGQAGAFRPPNNARLFRVTLAPATLPVRREVVCTDLRQTGPRLEPGCSERRGIRGRLRRFCLPNLPWPE